MIAKDIDSMGNIKKLKKCKSKQIKVFVCGGGNTVAKTFCDDAYEVGKCLAELDTAYGQGGQTERHTTMGETYFGYKENGGKSANIFVRDSYKEDIDAEYKCLDGAYIVDTLSDLIKAQYLWSDVVVIMPGGAGTCMEILGYMEHYLDYKECPQIILYNKKVGNSRFFDSFKEQISTMFKYKFIARDVYEFFTEVKTVKELKKELEKRVKDCKFANQK